MRRCTCEVPVTRRTRPMRPGCRTHLPRRDTVIRQPEEEQMRRMTSLSLAALIGAGAVATPAVAQERATEPYQVADRDFQERHTGLPAGTAIAVTLSEEVPLERDRIGDTFDAVVTRDVVEGDKVVIPEGAPAKVKLVESSERNDAATLRLAQVEANGEMHDVAVGDARADVSEDRLGTGEKTAVGAAAGAVVGAVTGAGVIEGAVVGAGGGLAWGLLSDRDREIDDGTSLRFELQDELDVR